MSVFTGSFCSVFFYIYRILSLQLIAQSYLFKQNKYGFLIKERA